MRTKTLLVAGAVLALSLAASQAQVYSANVVGYINVTVPGQHFAEIANQLNTDTNGIDEVYANGLISDFRPPNTGSNSVYLKWSGSSFIKYYYYNTADAATAGGNADLNDNTPGWYSISGDHAGVVVSNGVSAFVYNPTTSPMTITTVGTVLQGTNVINYIPSGLSFLALGDPVQTNLDCAGLGLPGSLLTSSSAAPNTGNNDVALIWSGTSYVKYYYYNTADAATAGGNADLNTSTPGFYSISGDLMPFSAFPAPGHGFILSHTGSTITWTNIFTVQ